MKNAVVVQDMRDLCITLHNAKMREKSAKEERLQAEANLLAAFSPQAVEGTENKETDGFKISVSSKLTRKLDYKAYQELNLPDNLSFVDLKPNINLKNLRATDRLDPALSAYCVTTKSAKPSIKVQEI